MFETSQGFKKCDPWCTCDYTFSQKSLAPVHHQVFWPCYCLPPTRYSTHVCSANKTLPYCQDQILYGLIHATPEKWSDTPGETLLRHIKAQLGEHSLLLFTTQKTRHTSQMSDFTTWFVVFLYLYNWAPQRGFSKSGRTWADESTPLRAQTGNIEI